jgi:hypothetical protein
MTGAKLGLFSLAGLLWSTPAAARPAYAIVVGNNASPTGDERLAPLRFADDDAVRYAEILGRVAAEVHLLTVLDAKTQRRHPGLAERTRPPTRAALDAAVRDVAARLSEAPGPVYVVFSGHGSNAADGEPYLALLDGDLTRTALFEDVLGALPAPRIHLVVDACNAGAMVGARGPFDREVDGATATVSPAARAAVLDARSLDRFPHVGAIVATTAGRASHEWSRIESGVFTHELLSGLLGPADVSGDLRVEYSEIQAFVAAANSRVADPRARPEIVAIPPAQDHRAPLFSMEDLPGPFLRGEAHELGHFFIELGGGRRYLDAHVGDARPVTILLPSGAGGFVRTPTSEAELPGREDGVIELDDLDFRAVRLAARGSLDETLRQDLFAAPFDAAYYRGFVDSRSLVPADLEIEARAPLSERWTWKERWAAGLFGLSAAALISTGVTGGLAARTKAQFEDTSVQRTAAELADRYDALVVATWVGAAVAAVAAGTGAGLWVSGQPSAPDDSADVSVGVSGRF